VAIAQPGEYIQPEVYSDFSQLKGKVVVADSTLCNCYAYVKAEYPTLPSTNDILNNLNATGTVAVFYYSDVGLYHYAVLVGETDTHYIIEETNYQRCKFSTRQVPKDDHSLLGFFNI
jgi:hypothetical protein